VFESYKEQPRKEDPQLHLHSFILSFSLVVVLDAEELVPLVTCVLHAIQAPPTHGALEAVRVVGGMEGLDHLWP